MIHCYTAVRNFKKSGNIIQERKKDYVWNEINYSKRDNIYWNWSHRAKSWNLQKTIDFSIKVLKSINDDPQSEVSKVLTKGIEKNVHYIQHYKQITCNFKSAQDCYNSHKQSFNNKMKQDIAEKKRIHSFSALDDYMLINPTCRLIFTANTDLVNLNVNCLLNTRVAIIL